MGAMCMRKRRLKGYPEVLAEATEKNDLSFIKLERTGIRVVSGRLVSHGHL